MPKTLVAIAAVFVLAGTVSPKAPAAQRFRSEPDDSRLTEAQRVLQRAWSLFESPAAAFRSHSPVAGGRDATLVLRDLAMRTGALSPAERARARSILARPTDGAKDPGGFGYRVPARSWCGVNLCLHWVRSTGDAPPNGDVNHSGLNDWVEHTRSVLLHVWNVEIGDLAYKEPKPDDGAPNFGTRGNPDERLDVYLADTGARGIYGYCATDDATAKDGSHRGVSSYCVLDNDFQEFPGSTPLDDLKATAAHEFFHAVQFGYDWREDVWFMEGTATWVEDLVYDGINDHYQYLRDSALTVPKHPVDKTGGGFPYGSWLFFRFLEEHAGGPATIRRAWSLAQAADAGPGLYSLQALRRALAHGGRDFAAVFTDFSANNAVAARSYAEGAGYRKLTGPTRVARDFTLGPGRRGVADVLHISHLASKYVALRPSKGLADAHLRVHVDLPARYKGARATVVLTSPTGASSKRRINLDEWGNGGMTIPFGRRVTKKVMLALASASTRLKECGKHGEDPSGSISCSGKAIDDRRPFSFTARLAP